MRSNSFTRSSVLTLLTALSVSALLLPACKSDSGDDAAQSGATNWLRCKEDIDCAGVPRASCGDDGYCLDEEGDRIQADRVEADDDSTGDDSTDDDATDDDSTGAEPTPDDDSTGAEPTPDDEPELSPEGSLGGAGSNTGGQGVGGSGIQGPGGAGLGGSSSGGSGLGVGGGGIQGPGGAGLGGSSSGGAGSDTGGQGVGGSAPVGGSSNGGASLGGSTSGGAGPDCDFDSCHPERCDEEGEPCCDPYPGDGVNYCTSGLECTQDGCAVPIAGEVCGDVQCDEGLICCDRCIGQCVNPLSGAACPDDNDPDRVCDEAPCGDYPVCVDNGGADVSCTQCLSVGVCPELLCTPTHKEACDAFCPAPNHCFFTAPPQPPQELVCDPPIPCETVEDCGYPNPTTWYCDDGLADPKCEEGFCVADCAP